MTMQPIEMKITNPTKHLGSSSEVHRNYSDTEKQRIAKASRDFESLLTSMMLKSMTKTTDGLFGDTGYGGDVLDSVFEMEMAKKFSEGNGMGIANDLYRKLTGEELVDYSKRSKFDSLIETKNVGGEAEVKNKDLENIQKRVPSTGSLKKLSKYEPIINQVSEKFGLNKNLIRSVILTESAANEKAISSAGAKGLMQLMDSTSADMGVRNSFDPVENILGGSKYLSNLLRKYDGNLERSLAAYNAGPGNVDKYDGIPPFEETQNYVKRIKEYLTYFEG